LDSRAIHPLITHLQNHHLFLPLKLPTQHLKQILFPNISHPILQTFKQQIHFIPPLPLTHLHEPQTPILTILTRLHQPPQILIPPPAAHHIILYHYQTSNISYSSTTTAN
ncbi:FliG C-terminal domain-containing protein, partial [Bacillus sp. WP8]|uniref:FliG C-terminal domain-containing protein n=1 Tax=Bacillus sp. WP8 TaxID=756828 RepID=UPI0011A47071